MTLISGIHFPTNREEPSNSERPWSTRSGAGFSRTPKDTREQGYPLYGIRRTLQIGGEHLTNKQAARRGAKLALGDPGQEVTLAWQCYQKLRNIYHAPPARGRELVTEVISSFPTCPIPEVARLGRTLKQ